MLCAVETSHVNSINYLVDHLIHWQSWRINSKIWHILEDFIHFSQRLQLLIVTLYFNSEKKRLNLNLSSPLCDPKTSKKKININKTNVCAPYKLPLYYKKMLTSLWTTRIYIYKVVISVCLSVCLSDHNSGTPVPICHKSWLGNTGGPRECSWF